MKQLKLGENITALRKKANITQDQLASWIGVSKSSVSKWETNTSYPDIVFLPQLASLFNVTVDELMGYEPQLTNEAITTLYHQLSKEIAQDADAAWLHCEDLLHMYPSCFPFLYKMTILFLNHSMLFKEPSKVLDKALSLCHFIKKECSDPLLVKDTLTLEVMVYISSNRPQQALTLLGETLRPIPQDSELTAACHQQLGNSEKAYQILQVSAYQHLLFLIQDSLSFMMLKIDDYANCQKTITKIEKLLSLYQIARIHPYTALQAHLSIAQIYAHHQMLDEAFTKLMQFSEIIASSDIEKLQCSDAYFTEIDSWLTEIKLDTQPPRDILIILDSLLQILQTTPEFQEMKQDVRYQHCLRMLQQKKEENLYANPNR